MALDSTQSKGRINLEKAAVMLVESNQQGMDILSQVFAGFGVRSPYKCTTSEEAQLILRSVDLDLIVVDAELSDKDGFDFVTELRRSNIDPNRFTSIMIVCGHTRLTHVKKARDCGANFVVSKPITPRIVLDRVMWIAREPRAFIEAPNYLGPDRRFQNVGPPPETEGRRKDDLPLEVGDATTPNLPQQDIDALFLSPTKPTKKAP